MPQLARFGVSLEKDLLARFDKHISEKQYPNRSEALRDLIRERLVRQEWAGGKEIAGAIVIIYDHHRRELLNKLTEIQHRHQDMIVSSQHVHLDHDNCLEVVVVKGRPRAAERLCSDLRSQKGVKYGALTLASIGKGLG